MKLDNQKIEPFICYVAGKSGGHIIPALTHAQNEKRKNKALKVLFFSTNSALDRSLLDAHKDITVYKPLELGNIPRKNIFAWPKFMMQLMMVVWQSFSLLKKHKPAKVVSMGGYISVPVCLAARVLGIPIEVYELNVVPGVAVKLVSKWAQVTHLCFAQTKHFLPASAPWKLAAYPLRYTDEDRCEVWQARKKLGIPGEHTKVILVLGGSQGSRFINELMQNYVLKTKHYADYYIIHQTGAADVESVRAFYVRHGITALVFAYRPDIHLCYAAADIVVARAGAGTLFELLFFHKPSLIIPLETATTDHQKDNALSMQSENPELFVVFLQADVEKSPRDFFDCLG